MVSPVPQLPTAAGLAWNSVDVGEGSAPSYSGAYCPLSILQVSSTPRWGLLTLLAPCHVLNPRDQLLLGTYLVAIDTADVF